MIDNIEIHLSDFSSYGCKLIELLENYEQTPNLRFQPSFMKRGTVFKGYSLQNDKGNHSLTINYVKRDDILTIEGSLRKWQLGAGSLMNLHQNSFIRALTRLSELLMIPYDNLIDGRIKSLEIGYTFCISDMTEGIIPRMIKYSTFEKYGSKTSIAFNGGERTMRVYDQATERRDKGFKRIGKLIASKSKRKYLRIEVGLRNYKPILDKFNILKVKGLIKKYYDLTYYLNEEIGKIVMIEGSVPDLNSLSVTKMPTLKKYIFQKGIYEIGFENVLSCIKNINDSKGNKSKYKKDMINILTNDLDYPQYTVNKFREELKKELENYLCTYSDYPAIVLYFT
jgi:hypothetical protein